MDADSILARNRRDTHASSLTLDPELKVYDGGDARRGIDPSAGARASGLLAERPGIDDLVSEQA